MAEYSRWATGSYTQALTGTAIPVLLPFQPSIVKLTNYTAYGAFALHGIPSATWYSSMGQGTAAIFINAAGPVLITDQVTSNGISTFSAGQLLQLGPQLQIASIAKASPTIVTTASAHGLSVGQVVILEGLYQSATTGMPQMSNMQFVITAVGSTTTFTVLWNSSQSNYTALAASPTGAFVRQVLYPFLYEPSVVNISAVTTGSTTTVTTTNNHNFVVGQEIAFRLPAKWGFTQANSLPNAAIPGSPIYSYVTSVTSNTVFICNLNSTGFTAFNSNPTVASVPGLTAPQVLAVGDVNSGGWPYTGGALYPSPSFPTSSGGVSTINGPAIQGAFVNNTAQGFVIGAGSGATDASSHLSGTTADFVVWEAAIPDLAM